MFWSTPPLPSPFRVGAPLVRLRVLARRASSELRVVEWSSTSGFMESPRSRSARRFDALGLGSTERLSRLSGSGQRENGFTVARDRRSRSKPNRSPLALRSRRPRRLAAGAEAHPTTTSLRAARSTPSKRTCVKARDRDEKSTRNPRRRSSGHPNQVDGEATESRSERASSPVRRAELAKEEEDHAGTAGETRRRTSSVSPARRRELRGGA